MTPQSLIKPSVCPPDGFRYVFPSTGYVVHDWTYDAWLEKGRAHVAANKLPHQESLEQDMNDQLCKTLPPGWCNFDDPARPRVSTSLTWDDVQRGVEVFTGWIKSGMETVSQKEAERRADICSRCYLNVNVQGCSACHQAVKVLALRYKTKHDASLKTCAACRCFLRAKVHFPLSILDKNNPGAQALYPEFCWLKHDGPNYLHLPG